MEFCHAVIMTPARAARKPEPTKTAIFRAAVFKPTTRAAASLEPTLLTHSPKGV
jgi:hypothetical protein